MERYRTTGQLDDPSLSDGDTFLNGVNDFDSNENLQQGQCQTAINKDFTQANASTRGGITSHPQLGILPFGIGGPWTSRVSAAAYDWTGIAYGNGRFVAVSQGTVGDDSVMTSTDGVTWSLVATGFAGESWTAITYAGALFVAVGDGGGAGPSIMTSPNGIVWAARAAPDPGITWGGIGYGNGMFVAVSVGGATGTTALSTDGSTWTAGGNLPTVESWTGVAYGAGLFVAVAGAGATTKIATSPNGLTWTARTSPAANWSAVIFARDTFVAVGGDAVAVATSTDGIIWTARTAPATGAWTDITYGGGVFVAVASGGSPNVMLSPDGITWTAKTGASANGWLAVASGGGLYAAVSNTGANDRVMTAPAQGVFASGIYSDPNNATDTWVVMAGSSSACFVRFGDVIRTISYPADYLISRQSTIVQADNYLIIMAGPDLTPIRWDGNWSGAFELMPAHSGGAGFEDIPHSDHATYYVNRLWVKSGKDMVAASDALDFTTYDDIFNDFNLNTGNADYVVCTYPFGIESLLVLKNKSIQLLQNVAGGLDDVIATEVTRQVGIVGINAVVGVGPDIAYVSDRNVNLITLTATSNAVQHKTEPLSRNIKSIMRRVNWNYGYKISVGYWDNKLYVALPLDNSTYCNAVAVYNFVTDQWWGEWNFNDDLAIAIQGFVLSDYYGAARLHMVTENGRVFITDNGPQDISGTFTAEISDSVTTRAYRMDNNNRVNRRMWADLGTNRPNFSVTAYVDGVGEFSQIVSDQTFSRADSWLFSDSTYSLNNSGDDYNREGRKDYAGYCSESIQSQSGFLPEALQEYRLPIVTRRKGRLTWAKIENTQGKIVVNGTGFEARPEDRGNLIQVI